MNQQRGFTLLEMMLVLALVAITASVVLFTYGREDAASTRARETAARFTAALELAIDRATLVSNAYLEMVSLSVSISLIQHGALWYRAKHHQPGAGFHYKKMPQTRAKMTGVKNSQFNFSHLNLMTATSHRL